MSNYIAPVPIGYDNIRADTFGKLLPAVTADLVAQTNPSTIAEICWNVGESQDVATAHTDTVTGMLETFDLLNVEQHNTSDENYSKWLVHSLLAAQDSGLVDIGPQQVYICGACEAPQALSTAPQVPANCACCSQATGEHIATRDVVTMTMPKTSDSLAQNIHIINQPSNWRGQLATLPDSLLISKRRHTGVSLETIGLTDLHLDPRVVNAGMHLFRATQNQANNAWAIVDASHLNKVVPFSNALTSSGIETNGFIGIAKMPVREVLSADYHTGDLPPSDIVRVCAMLALGRGNWMKGEQRTTELARFLQKTSLKIRQQQVDSVTELSGILTPEENDIRIVVQQLLSSMTSKK